ncbi:MAG: class I SAM-dependent methyltransferase [Sedimentisphaerales bacterium]|nr:class I SAM-dependent methyltransferase [Sedimentisphaerales bacterium]
MTDTATNHRQPGGSRVSCPVCTQSSYLARPAVKGFDIYKCSACRLEFTWPMPDDTLLARFYANYNDIRAEEEVLLANARTNIEYLRLNYGLTAEAQLLDFGSGKGCFVSAGNSKNWYNFDPFTTDCHADKLPQGNFDWITLWGVLEHLTDPAAALARINSLLAPGGYLAATTISTELNIPFQYKPPEHTTYWNQAAICQLLNHQALELIEYRQYFMKQLSDIYMSIILRTVPERYRKYISSELPDFVEIPTNEVFFVARKAAGS